MNDVMLITGGSGGIGSAIARRAGVLGYDVCIHYHKNKKAAYDLCESLEQHGGRVIAVCADVREEDQVISLFHDVQQFGQLTAFVNNAGIITPISKLSDMDSNRIQNVFAINVLGSFLCVREAVKAMSKQNGGRGGSIVNISSMAAKLGSSNEFIDYAATKGAIDTLTTGLAKEVADEGIRVNAVRPGLIETDLHIHTGDPDRPEKLKLSVPMKRPGTAEEVAGAVMWLLGEEASYVTGACLDVSGGR